MDEQGTFDFADFEEEITFISCTGHCNCGREYTVKRISIAHEMYIRCIKCGRQIKV